jgi:hypothetical protein
MFKILSIKLRNLHNFQLLSIILLGAYLFVQLISLSSFTLPWFDETFMVSITHSLSQGKGLELTISPLHQHSDQVLTYGPVYFILTLFSTKLIGFTPFGFRLVNFIAAMLVVWMLYRKLKPYRYAQWFIPLILLDPMFLQDAHSGRMDMVALLFAIGAFYSINSKKYTYRSFVAIGISAALALLTTPRVAFILLPAAVCYLIKGFQTKQTGPVLLAGGVALLIYCMWIFVAFGNLQGIFNYYVDGSSEDLAGTFIGINTQIPVFQWPILGISLFSTAFYIYRYKHFSPLQINMLIPVILFYLFVVDTGIYSALIIPFLYALAITGWQSINNRKTVKMMFLALLFLNAGTALCKFTSIALTRNERNYSEMNARFQNHIPSGARIVGDDSYYYAAINNNNDYQYIKRAGETEERIAYHQQTFKPHYLMIGPYTPPDVAEEYKKAFNITDSVQMNYPENSKLKQTILKILNYGQIKHPMSYEGTIYKVTQP